MSNGGYKGATPPRETSPEHYPGVWGLPEQFQAQADGNWPFQETDCAPKSLRFDSSASAKLSRTFPAEGNRRTWTWSGWVKRGKITGDNQPFLTANSSSGNSFFMGWHGYYSGTREDAIEINNVAGTGDGYITTAVFRDPSAWYSVVISFDSTQSSDRIKCYVNGVKQTWQQTSNGPGLNDQWKVNDNIAHTIGGTANSFNGQGNLDSCLAEVQFIDGQALTPDAFTFIDGQGILQPKRFTGDYSSGPVYSNFLTGGIDSSYPAPNGFDGVTSGIGVRTSANGTMVWQPSAPIGFNNSFKIYCSLDGTSYGNTFTVTHAGGTTDFTSSVATGTTNTAVDLALISGVTSPITKITVASGGSNPRFSAIELDGQILTDPTVGRNSFHLDYSDGAKDQSGLGNDWTANNLSFSGTVVAESRIWESSDSDWAISGGGANATKTTTNSYADVFTGKFEPGKLYAFTSTFPAGDSNGGWFFTDSNSTSLSGTHPNQGRGSNSIGQRGNNSTLGVHGSYATANGISSNYNSAINGFSDSDTYQGATINWVVDRVNHKVWAKTASGSSWIKGGDPTDPTSTASFLIPSTGDIYFGVIQYDGITNLNLASYSVSQTITTGDDCVDSPVNGYEASTSAGGERRGNYATWNPVSKVGGGVFSEGNLLFTGNNSWSSAHSTITALTTGKWYYEMTLQNNPVNQSIGSMNQIVGWTSNPQATTTYNNTDWVAIEDTGWYRNFGSQTNSSTVMSAGGVIGILVDLDANTFEFKYNNTSRVTGTIGGTAGRAMYPFITSYSASQSKMVANFGQRPFKYAQSGYEPLATSFLPEPTIKEPSTLFDAKLFVGTGGTQSITMDNSLSPDLVWIKQRNNNGAHMLFDSVRGATKRLVANQDLTEGTVQGVTSFNSAGFSLGNDADCNLNNINHIAWVWDAGDATTTVAAGGLNSSIYDQAQTWSSSLASTTGFRGSEPATNAFDGSVSTVCSSVGQGTVTYTSPVAVPSGSTIEVYVNGGDHTVSVNGGSNQTVSAGSFNTLEYTSPTTSPFTLAITRNANADTGIKAIKIGGKVLVDYGVTPPNIPTIPSTVRARPEAGFSISSFTGTGSAGSVAHNLNKEPELIILKGRNFADNWRVYHKDLDATSPANYYVILELNNAISSNQGASFMNSTKPGKSVFSLGTDSAVNGSTRTMIAYCWTSIEGYSSIGSFENPSSSEGAFVFCGFKPKLIIAKCVKNISSSSGLGDWMIYDTSRLPFNNPGDNNHLYANQAHAEDTFYSSGQGAIDILSNGFKIRHPNSSPLGDPGRLYIYAAWAESPFASQARAR